MTFTLINLSLQNQLPKDYIIFKPRRSVSQNYFNVAIVRQSSMKGSFHQNSTHNDSLIQQMAREDIPTPMQGAITSNGKPRVEKRIAVVTGANKGIGLETVKQLASQGITVVLTARDEKRGIEAIDGLYQMGLNNVVFHKLDVLDPISVQSLATFISNKFGSLDILVNNAAITGAIVDEERLKTNTDPETEAWIQEVLSDSNYETSKLCINTNYYGIKRVIQALLPLLHLSSSGARIVNVSSRQSELRRIKNDEIRNELNNVETLTEEKLDKILERFLHDLKENKIEEGGWSMMVPAYSISKTALNAYTRILAKKNPKMMINCVHPGHVNTDINLHTGTMPVEEGAKGPLKCALLPDGGPTGCYFHQTQVASF